MKNKKFFSIFLLGIFLISFVSAIEVEMKSSVKLGENFIVKISGVFLNSIKSGQINFYRGNSPSEFGITNIEEIAGDYYFYLEIPLEKIPGNYSMVIHNVKYQLGREIITNDITIPFTIEEELAPFSISPPLIITNKDYSVKVQNLLNHTITIDLELIISPEIVVETNNSENESLEKEKSRFLEFFDILFGKTNSTTNETLNESIQETNNSPMTGFVTEELELTKESVTLKSGEIKILNFEPPKEETFEKLELYYDGEGYGVLVYNPEEIQKDNEIVIDENETQKENETSFEENNDSKEETNNSEEELNYEGLLLTDEGEIIDKLTNKTICNITQSCSECRGKICISGKERCEGNKVQSKTGYCCLGECIEIEKTSTGKIIGWVIIIGVGLFLVWFIKKKYLRAGPGKIDLVSIAKGK